MIQGASTTTNLTIDSARTMRASVSHRANRWIDFSEGDGKCSPEAQFVKLGRHAVVLLKLGAEGTINANAPRRLRSTDEKFQNLFASVDIA